MHKDVPNFHKDGPNFHTDVPNFYTDASSFHMEEQRRSKMPQVMPGMSKDALYSAVS